jgi:hypothetical protein
VESRIKVKHTEQFREHVRDIMIHRDVLRATYTDFLLAKALRGGERDKPRFLLTVDC